MSLPVCSCEQYQNSSAGCKHTNPALSSSSSHRCRLPNHEHRTLQWECGWCHRVWTPGEFGWTEVRGPAWHQETETT